MENHFKTLMDSSMTTPSEEQKQDDVFATPSQLPLTFSNSTQNNIVGDSSSSPPTPLPPPSEAPMFIFGGSSSSSPPPLRSLPSEAPVFVFGQNRKAKNFARQEELVDKTSCNIKKNSKNLMGSPKTMPFEEPKQDFVFALPTQLPPQFSNSTGNPIIGGSSSNSSTPPLPQQGSEAPLFIFVKNYSSENYASLEDLVDTIDTNNEKIEGENVVDGVDKDSPVKDVAEDEAQGEEKKTWNLRPRKPIQMQGSQNVDAGGSGTRNLQEKKNAKKKKKKSTKNANVPIMPHFSTTLTKEEIREDFIKMTGKPPPARPKTKKKVKKEIQESIDRLNIGAILNLVTLKDYEPSRKN